MLRKMIAYLLVLIMVLLTGTVCAESAGETEMTNLDFFKSLSFDAGLSVVTEIFERLPL